MSKTMKENHEKGFTLVELLVAMVISALVMASVYSVYYTQQRSYIVQEEVAAMHQNLRAAMYFMEREIRMAGCDPKGKGIAGIEADSGASSIHFTEDVRGDDTDDSPDGFIKPSDEEDIAYYLNDVDGDGLMDLVRDTDPDDVEDIRDLVIAENISSLNFAYFDLDGDPVAPAGARLVQVTLVATNKDGDKTETLQTRINCRNMGI